MASSVDGTHLVAVVYGGKIWTAVAEVGAQFAGAAGTTAQFQYLGNGEWQPAGVPASQVTGTLPAADLPANVVTNGENGVTLSGALSGAISGNGTGLTNLNASQLTSGTLPSAALVGTYSSVLNFNNAGNSFSGNGGGLANLNASQLTSVGNASGTQNFFVGPSGNATMSGFGNTADGFDALLSNTSGNVNTAIGADALFSNTSGSYNTATGVGALYWNTSGSDNTAIGWDALVLNTNGSYNTAVGLESLLNNTNGSFNTAVGVESLLNNTNGSDNIALGYLAGYNIAGGSSNIDIGNPGLSTDTNIIRIGTAQTATILAGHVGIGTNNPGSNNVQINPTFELSNGYGLVVCNTKYGENVEVNEIANGNGIGLVVDDAALGDDTTDLLLIRNNVASSPQNLFVVGAGGTVTMSGSCTIGGSCSANSFITTSDRNAKENFQSVSAAQVLAKVSALPIQEWNFKTDTATRHIGPMAQDFFAAFGVGPDDKHIATVDEDGVALAAIQGLNEKVEGRSKKVEGRMQKLEAENQKLEEENTELKARLEKLERLVNDE
jgi:hypothetical protein